jgi:hypothetical protein
VGNQGRSPAIYRKERQPISCVRYKRTGELRARSGWVRKILSPPGFKGQTVQPDNTPQYTAVRSNTLQYTTVPCSTQQYNTLQAVTFLRGCVKLRRTGDAIDIINSEVGKTEPYLLFFTVTWNNNVDKFYWEILEIWQNRLWALSRVRPHETILPSHDGFPWNFILKNVLKIFAESSNVAQIEKEYQAFYLKAYIRLW